MGAGMTLLGFAPARGAEALRGALAALPGPAVSVAVAGGVAALAQAPEARRGLLLARDRAGLLRNLHGLQRRLEAACQAGPFLPADPAAGPLPEAELRGLLAGQGPALEAALATHGGRHQWDVILRWSPEGVLARGRGTLAGLPRAALAEAVAAALARERAQRQEALRAALRPVSLDMAAEPPVSEDAATGVTLLVPAGGEAAIEAALGSLPEAARLDASADLRGPLPPIAFAAVRVASLAPGEVERAWTLLGLPDALPPAELRRRWRALAAELHPDRAGPRADPVRFAAAAAAYRLLRDLAGSGEEPVRRAALAARAGRRLALPEAA